MRRWWNAGCLLLFIALCVLLTQTAATYRVRYTTENLLKSTAPNFEEGVQYWVDFGTLLGFTRDRRAILGDNDGDLCIPDTLQNHEKVRRALAPLAGEWLNWGAYRVYGDFRTVHVDIYLVEETATSFKVATGEVVDKNLVFPLRQGVAVCN